MAFTCSICEEASSRICCYCTKDTCDNHLCEKCLCCSDCCECEVPLRAPEPLHATGSPPEPGASSASPVPDEPI